MTGPGFIDPAERSAISEAFNWAQDHGLVSHHATLDALVQATATLAPGCDTAFLKSYLNEMAAPDPAGSFMIALSPPFSPLEPGAWRAGPIAPTRPGGRKGIAVVVICNRAHLDRLLARRGGMP